jgi:hypothetical protein
MNVIRTMLEGRGSYPRQKTRMAAPRKGKELLQMDCPVKLKLTHHRDPTSNWVGSAKGGGRRNRRRGHACNGVRVGITDIHTNLSYLLLFCICLQTRLETALQRQVHVPALIRRTHQYQRTRCQVLTNHQYCISTSVEVSSDSEDTSEISPSILHQCSSNPICG